MKEENEAIIKALNMYGRVPEQWELLNEIERLNNIINGLEKWLEKEKDKKEEIAVAQGIFIDKDLSERLDHQIGTIDFVLVKLQELKGSE